MTLLMVLSGIRFSGCALHRNQYAKSDEFDKRKITEGGMRTGDREPRHERAREPRAGIAVLNISLLIAAYVEPCLNW